MGVVVLALLSAVALSAQLSVSVSQTGDIAVSVGGKVWLRDGPKRVVAAQKWLSSADKSLAFLGSETSTGSDRLGQYAKTTLKYASAADASRKYTVAVRDYTGSKLDALVFEQRFDGDFGNTSAAGGSKENVMSAFPAFLVKEQDAGILGWGSYYGSMLGGQQDGVKYGPWSDKASIASGTQAGPTFIFNPNMDKATPQAIVIGSMDQFMIGTQWHNKAAGTLEFGLMGSIEAVPDKFSHQVLLAYGAGVGHAVSQFGAALLHNYGKTTPFPLLHNTGDDSIDKLGYCTDNGAFYYYKTETGQNYHQTLVDVAKQATKLELPYQWILLDSWWYYKGIADGVKNWTARPDIFPNGIAAFHKDVPWTITAHNRYWSPNTDYAKQNGGKYNFLVDSKNNRAMPMDPTFWPDLFRESKKWGLAVYEQDWLHNEYEVMPEVLKNVTYAGEWLRQMGTAAQDAGLKIQYCMAFPRHALNSVMFQAVDQIRVSEDYAFDLDHRFGRPMNLYIGTTSLLATALGLASYKDVWWSTSNQTGNPIYGNGYEESPAAEGAVATLSAGPVSPGDKIGFENPTLIMKSCRSDGLVLKPSYGLAPVESYFTQKAFGSGGPQGEVWYTHSLIPTNNAFTKWWHVIGLNVASPFELSALDFPIRLDIAAQPKNRYFAWRAGDMGSVVDFGLDNPVTFPKQTLPDFTIWHIGQYIEVGGVQWGIIGEIQKWVPVAKQRISSIHTSTTELRLSLVGAPSEKIRMIILQDTKQVTFDIAFPQSGTYELILPPKQQE